MAKIAIVYYSMYGHIKALADHEKKGIEAAGGKVDVYQLAETLPAEVLTKMHAPPKPTDVPVLDDPAVLEQYDGFLLGIPTRYGRLPAQWAAFLDRSGKQWMSGTLQGKLAGVFVSSGSLGGGQEVTVLSVLSTLAHLGIIFVPLGYANSFPILTNVAEARGGSPWGAGTLAGSDGSRQPSAQELELAEIQGNAFYKTLAKHVGDSAVKEPSTSANVTSPGKVAPAPTPGSDSQKKQQEGPKEGPCGLPSKCVLQ